MTPDEKRRITYQISKNKGLTPHRKKELRNPRVKNRMKYRKAKIRRKGQVCLTLKCIQFFTLLKIYNSIIFCMYLFIFNNCVKILIIFIFI